MIIVLTNRDLAGLETDVLKIILEILLHLVNKFTFSKESNVAACFMIDELKTEDVVNALISGHNK